MAKRKHAKISITSDNGKSNAEIEGTPYQIVESLVSLLKESDDLLRFFKAAVEVVDLEKEEEINIKTRINK